ncbi:MAG TPA: stage 0 sporulation family protein [Anaerolineae bacterium]|nr:stage 0 sporulation family protein [Anaerolineae bacterium]
MPQVVSIQFQPVTKLYYFDPGPYTDLLPGEWVLVETTRGKELAQVVLPAKEVDEGELEGPLKRVLRRASKYDLDQKAYWAQQAEAAKPVCQEKANKHGLKMRVVRCHYSYNGERLTVEFVAEQRVDFRALVRDLARHFRTRIEMRQIGVRDQAKLVGDWGRCGRELCCRSFLREFHSVSIRMAKNQNIPLSSSDISGVCGRLMCSLAYENDMYAAARKHLPKVGQKVLTPDGPGVVRYLNVLLGKVSVYLETGAMKEYDAPDLSLPGHPERVFLRPDL